MPIKLKGGPFDKQTYGAKFDSKSSLVFYVKGFAGYYTDNGKWVDAYVVYKYKTSDNAKPS